MMWGILSLGPAHSKDYEFLSSQWFVDVCGLQIRQA
jgi:hypothetical protein